MGGKCKKWRVRVSGNNYYLENLSMVCNTEMLTIENNEDNFLLISSEFNNIQDGGEVYKRAKKLLSLVNGSSSLILGRGDPIEVDRNLICIDEEGRETRWHIHETLYAKSRISGVSESTVTWPDGRTEILYQAAPVPRWVALAKKNKDVADVLNALSEKDLDFNKLNIIFETIESCVSVVKRRWVRKADIDLFTQTVQPYRHGKSGLDKRKWKNHKSPMNFFDARALVFYLSEC